MPGTLYVVATPIGHLDDLGLRASEILKTADLIVCEDTRHTRTLLERYAIGGPVDAYHNFNEVPKAETLLGRLEAGQNIAMVSDAGTPAISDPGYRLIRLCRQRGIPVIPVPGPSAAVAALSVSGLPTDQFRFVGFLPSRKEARRRALEALKPVACTLIFYEAPRRLLSSLEDMLEIFGDREAFVGREMTKLHEEYLFGSITGILSRVRQMGEAVILVHGADPDDFRGESLDTDAISRQDLLKMAARRLGITRKQLYDALYKKKQ